MIPTELVGTAKVPGNGGELRCFRHDGDYEIFVDGIELMSTRAIGSEEALAELAIERFGRSPPRRVLVGGLGMGFTLARVLSLVGRHTTVECVELVPEVVTWNRELFGHCADHPLLDPRTHLIVDDVAEVLGSAEAEYDVVLLDVDNGPEGLSRDSNWMLYDHRGLVQARRALTDRGVLAVWSSSEDPPFTKRLHHAGFDVVERQVRARRTKGPWRTIWVATVAGS